MLNFSSPSELNDNALSSLLSASRTSNSVKSSESSKSRKRLTGIEEDAGEGPDPGPKFQGRAEKREELADVAAPGENATHPKNVGEEAVTTAGIDSGSVGPRNETTRPAVVSTAEPSSSVRGESSSGQYPTGRTSSQIESSSDLYRRESTQTTRTSFSIQNAYNYKPKVKVGPRPSTEMTSESAVVREARPISSLPAGVQLLQRQSKYPVERPKTSDRPKTQQTPSKPFFISSASIPPVPPPLSVAASSQLDRPVSRAGSAATVPAYTHYPESLISEPVSNVTPEKQRLMKALQKRRKAKLVKAVSQDAGASTTEVNQATNGSVSAHDATLAKSEKVSELSEEPVAKSKTPTSSDYAKTVTPTGPLSGEETPKARALNVMNPRLDTDALSLAVDRKSRSDLQAEEQPASAITREFLSTVSTDNSSPKTVENGASHPNGLEEGSNVSVPVPNVAEEEHVDNQSGSPIGQIEPLRNNGDSATSPIKETQTDMNVGVLTHANESQTKLSSKAVEKMAGAHENEDGEVVTPANLFDTQLPEPTSHATTEVQEGTDEATSLKLETDSVNEAATLESKRAKRRGMVSPITTADISEANSLSGDSFLDELQTATVEEAKPAIVSKSPAMPFFPLSPKSVGSQRSSDGTKSTRRLSIGNDDDIPPVPSSSASPISAKGYRSGSSGSLSRFAFSRSISNPFDALLPQKIHPPLPNGLGPSPDGHAQKQGPLGDGSGPKKGGMSSLISQRIKALEKFSSAPQPSASAPPITPSIVSKRKTSLATLPASAGRDSRGSPRSASPLVSPVLSPSPSGNALTRRFRPSKDKWTESKPEGLSVTATIVRDDAIRVPEQPSNIADSQPTNFHASPLTVQHQHKTPSILSKSRRRGPRPTSKSSSTSSLSSLRETVAGNKRDSISSRRSNSSRKDSVETVRPLSISSIERATGSDVDKKDSKRRSLLKRMSNISFSRRSIAQTMSPTLNDQPIIEHQEPEPAAGWTSAVKIGDLNVQFPDTLLWKRRHLEVDAQGNLTLAPSQLEKVIASLLWHLFLSDYVIELSHWHKKIPY